MVAGTASITLVLFDDKYEMIHDNVDIQKVNNLTESTFVPRGSTALLDAIGRTINEVGARLNKTDEDKKPEKVMVCILTDGMENASREFTNDKINEMINHQRNKYLWEFSFLAANQDAFSTARKMGISRDYTAGFAATGEGTRNAYKSLSGQATRYRSNT